ncbi:hypothetical protein GCM10027269_23210 [Kribbella endophytica]
MPTSSLTEPARAVAVDSPAAARAAAKYLIVTSGMWEDASLIEGFLEYYVSLLFHTSVSRAPGNDAVGA